ncbi:MAG: tRNA pseudouridine(55) synthase TruB [Syntrophobacter sp.]
MTLNRTSAAADDIGGILLVDKPAGVSSARVTAKVKWALKPRKIGHTGTLDPFATGVLVLCINEATRVADQFINLNKVYVSTLRFGVETDTLDRTGQIIRTSEATFSKQDLLDALQAFEGECVQKTPRFSAVKVGGQRLYKLSRKGIEVDRPEREVCIHSITLHSFDWPEAVIEVSCSKGTYIRQLASDIGEKMGTGAHLSELRRMSVGPFHVDQALQLEQFSAELPITSRLISLNEALSHLPVAVAGEEQVLARLRYGQLDPEWALSQTDSFSRHAGAVRIVTESNRLAALWWPNPEVAGSRRLRVFTF